jgi:DNA-binding beta-propeller fold protein YncE
MALGCSGAAGEAPAASGTSGRQAVQEALLAEFLPQLGDEQTAAIYLSQDPLAPGTTMRAGDRGLAEAPLEPRVLERAAWLAMVDYDVYGLFAHHVEWVLVDAATGSLERIPQQWFPQVDGQDLWSTSDARFLGPDRIYPQGDLVPRVEAGFLAPFSGGARLCPEEDRGAGAGAAFPAPLYPGEGPATGARAPSLPAALLPPTLRHPCPPGHEAVKRAVVINGFYVGDPEGAFREQNSAFINSAVRMTEALQANGFEVTPYVAHRENPEAALEAAKVITDTAEGLQDCDKLYVVIVSHASGKGICIGGASFKYSSADVNTDKQVGLSTLLSALPHPRHINVTLAACFAGTAIPALQTPFQGTDAEGLVTTATDQNTEAGADQDGVHYVDALAEQLKDGANPGVSVEDFEGELARDHQVASQDPSVSGHRQPDGGLGDNPQIGQLTPDSTPTPSPTPSPSPEPRFAFVANSAAGALSRHDVADPASVVTAPVGDGPAEVALDPDTGRIFVTNSWSNNLTVLGRDLDPVATLATGSVPQGVTVGNGLIVNVNSGDDTISVHFAGSLNPLSGSPFSSCGDNPTDVAYDPVRDRFMVVHTTSGNLVFLDGSTFAFTGQTTTGGSGPAAVFYEPVRDRIYVANRDGNSLAVFDAATTTQISGSPFATGGTNLASGPVGLAANSSRVWVANSGSSSVTVFDAATMIPMAGSPFPTGGMAPQGLAYDARADRVWVTNFDSATLTVYDASTMVPIGGSPFPAGAGPLGLTIGAP